MSKITISEAEQSREIQLLRYGTITDPSADDLCNDKELIVGVSETEPTLYLGHAPVGETVKIYKVILEKDLQDYEAIYEGIESNIIYTGIDNTKITLEDDKTAYVEFTILGKRGNDYKIIKRKQIYLDLVLQWSEDDIIFQTIPAVNWACTESLDVNSRFKFTSPADENDISWKIKVDNLIII